MNPETVRLIILGLTLAEKIAFTVGDKLIEIDTADMTDPAAIQQAFASAKAEGFPKLSFKPVQS